MELNINNNVEFLRLSGYSQVREEMQYKMTDYFQMKT